MPIDPQIQTILTHFSTLNPQPLENLSPDAARNNPTLKHAVEEMVSKKLINRLIQLAKPMPEPVGNISHQLIPTTEGELIARIYTPEGKGPFPVLVYFHGGGWVIANLDVYDSSCRALCNAVNCLVVSVAYRLAPENKYPAAVQDAYRATQWVIENISHFNGDQKRVAVGGESAGGNLATVVCLKAKAENGRMPIAQLLIYPVIDSSLTTHSMQKFVDTKPLYNKMMPWFWNNYLTNEKQKKEPYASPAFAENLEGLPPAIIVTAEYDPLRDEAEAYAKRLADVGLLINLTRYEGMVHEFFGLTGVVDKATEALNNTANYLKSIFKE